MSAPAKKFDERILTLAKLTHRMAELSEKISALIKEIHAQGKKADEPFILSGKALCHEAKNELAGCMRELESIYLEFDKLEKEFP